MSKTLVFGASLKPNRYSNLVVKRLIDHGIETVAFGQKTGKIETVKVMDRLEGIENIHTITLYLGPANQPEYYQDILKLKPKRVIFNPGTENPELYLLLKEAGIMAMEACTLVLLATDRYRSAMN
ncbi:MAG: CoA-binding protein [Flavobacteriaceae bacterium]